MNKFFITVWLLFFALNALAITKDEQTILNGFHQRNIKNCDKLILYGVKNVVSTNWNAYPSRFIGGIDGPTSEVSIRFILGSKNYPMSINLQIIESRKYCSMIQQASLIMDGDCKHQVKGSLDIDAKHPEKNFIVLRNKDINSMVYLSDLIINGKKSCLYKSDMRDRVKK